MEFPLFMNQINGGWTATPLKNDGVKVRWDDDIPNWMESHNPDVPVTTNQRIDWTTSNCQ